MKDMEVVKCVFEEKRAAFHSARLPVKLLPTKNCAWKIKDNISRLRLDVKVQLEDAVCAHEDWLEAIEAMNKLKYEGMQVQKRVNRALVDTRVHDAPAKFLAYDMSLAKHAKPGGPSGISGIICVLCDLSLLSFSTASRSMPNMCGAENALSVSEKL